MQISFRAVFLIVAASVVFHVSPWQIFAILFGYTICEYADQHQSNKAKAAVLDDETCDWKPDPKDSAWEEKGRLTRIKLSDHENRIRAKRLGLVRPFARHHGLSAKWDARARQISASFLFCAGANARQTPFLPEGGSMTRVPFKTIYVIRDSRLISVHTIACRTEAKNSSKIVHDTEHGRVVIDHLNLFFSEALAG